MAENVKVVITGRAVAFQKAGGKLERICEETSPGTTVCKLVPIGEKPEHVDWAAGMEKIRKAKEEAMAKAEQHNAPITVNDAPHKPTPGGLANSKRDLAVSEVTAIVDRLLNEVHGNGPLQPSSPSQEPGGGVNQRPGSELKYLDAVAQALRAVSPETKAEYIAHLAGLPADPGGAASTAVRDLRKQRPTRTVEELAKSLDAIAEDSVGGTPFALALRQARLAKGWSQARLAEEAMVHQNSIGLWERAHALPHQLQRRSIEAVLGVTLPLK